MMRALLAFALCLAPTGAGAQALINGQPPSLVTTSNWIAQSDVTLDASGNATWVFDPANPPPVVPAVVHLPRGMDANNPIICNWMVRTQVLVSIHCWRTNVSGLLSSLFGGTAAGAQVTLVARAIP